MTRVIKTLHQQEDNNAQTQTKTSMENDIGSERKPTA